jgi:hypothetical protein
MPLVRTVALGTIALGVFLIVLSGVSVDCARASTVTIHSGNMTRVNTPVTSNLKGGKVVTKNGNGGGRHPCKNC